MAVEEEATGAGSAAGKWREAEGLRVAVEVMARPSRWRPSTLRFARRSKIRLLGEVGRGSTGVTSSVPEE